MVVLGQVGVAGVEKGGFVESVVVWLLIAVVAVVWVVELRVEMIRGNSDLGSLLGRIAGTVVRVDNTRFHRPC